MSKLLSLCHLESWLHFLLPLRHHPDSFDFAPPPSANVRFFYPAALAKMRGMDAMGIYFGNLKYQRTLTPLALQTLHIS